EHPARRLSSLFSRQPPLHNPLSPGWKGLSHLKRTFAAIVQRTSKWDNSKPAQDQDGFEHHVKYMGALEAEGFIRLAGLMLSSNDVLFILEAESEDEVQTRLGQDPWRQDGHTRLLRLEEIGIRTWVPRTEAA